MTLLAGIQHVSTLTTDLDRLLAFYVRVFEAEITLDRTEEGLRHAFVEVGPGMVLHPFQVPGLPLPDAELPMFQRGRIDHVALGAATEEAFAELRRRLLAEAATDGVVQDVGGAWLMAFADPDGATYELIWVQPGTTADDVTARADWGAVELD